MAGFGKAILGALTGAAEGYGNYLQLEGKQRLDMEQEERQSQRAMALEQFRAGIQADRDTREDASARGRIVLTGLVNRTNNVAEVQARSTADAANDARDFETWKKKNAVEFGQMKTKLGIELSNDKQRELFKAEQEIRVDAAKDGGKVVGNVIDETTGSQVYQIQQADGSIRNYDSGVVVQRKSTTNPLTGEVTRDTSAPTKKATTGYRDEPATAAGGGGAQKSDLQLAMEQIATDYAGGRSYTDPRSGKKLTQQQALALARTRYGG